MAFVLEGKNESTLPEHIMGSVRLHNLDFTNRRFVDQPWENYDDRWWWWKIYFYFFLWRSGHTYTLYTNKTEAYNMWYWCCTPIECRYPIYFVHVIMDWRLLEYVYFCVCFFEWVCVCSIWILNIHLYIYTLYIQLHVYNCFVKW